MKLERSKEWWLKKIDSEPDCQIAAGAPGVRRADAGRFGMSLLRLRAKLVWTWRIGLIRRSTAFRWEMDVALGEWSAKVRQREWHPHLDYAGEPMQQGKFRDPPE